MSSGLSAEFIEMFEDIYDALKKHFEKKYNRSPIEKIPATEKSASKIKNKSQPKISKKSKVEQIADYIEAGWNNEQIAEMCSIKLSSVSQYRYLIKKKFGISSEPSKKSKSKIKSKCHEKIPKPNLEQVKQLLVQGKTDSEIIIQTHIRQKTLDRLKLQIKNAEPQPPQPDPEMKEIIEKLRETDIEQKQKQAENEAAQYQDEESHSDSNLKSEPINTDYWIEKAKQQGLIQ